MNRRILIAFFLLAAITAQAGLLGDLMRRRVPVAAASAGYTPTASTNLVLWWTYNSGDGSFQSDQSGNGNYGTQGTVSARCVISNNAAYFTGTSNLIQTVSTNLMNTSNEVTVTCWVNYSSVATYAMIWGSSDSGQTKQGGFQADVAGNKKVYGTYNTASAGGYTLSGATWVTNQWIFLAVAGKAGTPTRIYVDGVEAKGGNSTGNMIINTAWAAGRSPAYVGAISGFLDDCRIYNRSLTSNELVGTSGSVKSEGRQ